MLVSVSLGAAAPSGARPGVTEAASHISVQAPSEDPDALYRERNTPSQAAKAVEIWAARLDANPKDFESAWKVSRGRYWLGTNGTPPPARKAELEKGIAAARVAATLEPGKPEGHFWLAANMGALAESFGLRQGIKYRGDIKASLERVLAIDPSFLQGSADRALGRWYFKVPGMFGGDDRKSETHLRKALSYNENSVITHLFLAETLVDLGKKDQARDQLHAAIDAPEDPDWVPEDMRFREQAAALLKKLEK